MDEDVFPDPYGIVLQNGQTYNSAIIMIAPSMCYDDFCFVLDVT